MPNYNSTLLLKYGTGGRGTLNNNNYILKLYALGVNKLMLLLFTKTIESVIMKILRSRIILLIIYSFSFISAQSLFITSPKINDPINADEEILITSNSSDIDGAITIKYKKASSNKYDFQYANVYTKSPNNK